MPQTIAAATVRTSFSGGLWPAWDGLRDVNHATLEFINSGVALGRICRHRAITSRDFGKTQMGLVLASLETMGMAQILLASVLLGSYALALGDFAGARGRPIAIVATIFAALGFVALSDPWEAAVILLTLAPVGMGLFAGAAWTLCKVTGGSTQYVFVDPSGPLLPTCSRAVSVSLVERVRAQLRFI